MKKRCCIGNLGTAQVVIFGHSHHYFEKMIDGRLWLNPGSCGRSRFGGEVTMDSYGNRQWKLECQKNQFFCMKTNIYLLLDDLSRLSYIKYEILPI